jgi:preprotein translocase subunit SecG
MYSVVIVIHVIISLFLIAVILLQAGKGGGLSDTFGGSQMQNLFGTKSTTVLTKLTAVCAIGFMATCITLAVMSSRQTRSIVDNVRIPQPAASQAETQAPAPQAQVPAPVEPAPQGGTNEVK